MKNPWTTNPFMSLWLTSADSVLHAARVRTTAEGRRQAATLTSRGMRDAAAFWAALPVPSAGAPKRKRWRGQTR